MPPHTRSVSLRGPAAAGRGGRSVVYPLRTMSTWKDALMKVGECPQPIIRQMTIWPLWS
jgi:hypothetical protein